MILGVRRIRVRTAPPNPAAAAPAAHQIGRLDLLLALAAAVPSMICLAVLTGVPTAPAELAAWCLPVGAGIAVLLSRRQVLTAVLVLTAGIAIGIGPGDELSAGVDSMWGEFGSLSPLIAVGVVYYALGARSMTWQSLSMLVGSAVICTLLLGLDVPFLLIAGGWWLVGRVLRSRQLVADRLEVRAAELAAERERYVVEQVRLERTKIARELHDVVAHCMTVIVIQARAGQQLLDDDPIAAAEAADVIRAVAAEAEADIGALVELMNPDRSVPLSKEVLDHLISRAAATGTTVTARISGDVDDLDQAVAATAHRVVQESLTNAFRHAAGAPVRIDLDCRQLVSLRVTNAAPTLVLPLGVTGAGRGLLGMRERVLAGGGQISWGPVESGGWAVAAMLPQPSSISATGTKAVRDDSTR